MLGYRIPDADEAMLITGGRAKDDQVPVKVVMGRGAFVLPFFRRAQFLDLSMREAEVAEQCPTSQAIVLQVKAVCAFKPAPDPQSIANAAQRFLSDQGQMETLAGRILAGHLRSIIGSMTVEDIIRQRQTLAEQVLDASKQEMERLGLLVDSFQIESIDDGDAGYIAAMAQPHTAAIQQEARIAQAKADQASVEAEQQSARQQANFIKATSIVQSQNKAEVDRQQAESAQAGPLAQAQAEQAVIEQRTAAAQRSAELAEQELLATVVRPAEAQKKATIAQAEAQAQATRLASEAAATEGRLSLDQLLIQQLPGVAAAISDGFRGSNLTILNGTDGLSELATGVVAEAKTIFTAMREATRSLPAGEEPRPDRVGTAGDAGRQG